MENRGEGPMKRMFYPGIAAILVLFLSVCSGGGDRRPVYVAQILRSTRC